MQISDSNILWAIRDINDNYNDFATTEIRSYQPIKVIHTKNFSLTKLEQRPDPLLIVIMDSEEVIKIEPISGICVSELLDDADIEEILIIFTDEVGTLIDEERSSRVAIKKVKKERIQKKVAQLIKNRKK